VRGDQRILAFAPSSHRAMIFCLQKYIQIKNILKSLSIFAKIYSDKILAFAPSSHPAIVATPL